MPSITPWIKGKCTTFKFFHHILHLNSYWSTYYYFSKNDVITVTNACNTIQIVDLFIANNSLQIKKFTPLHTCYIEQQTFYLNKNIILKHRVLFLERKFQLFNNLEKGALRHFEMIHPSIVSKFWWTKI